MYDWVITFGQFALMGVMFYLSFAVKDEEQFFKFLYFGLGCFFLVSACFTLSMLALVPEVRLNYTDDVSNYWACDKLVNTCSGVPAGDSCSPYDETQCAAIANCSWAQYPDDYCFGTPAVSCAYLGAYDATGFKCNETAGCVWNATLVTAECDRVITTQVYGNYSSGYENFGASSWLAGWIVLTVVGFVIGYFVVMWFVKEIGLYQNRKKMKGGNYGRPY